MAQHDARNDAQLLVFKVHRPDLYARLLAELTPESRAAFEDRIAALEAEQALPPNTALRDLRDADPPAFRRMLAALSEGARARIVAKVAQQDGGQR